MPRASKPSTSRSRLDSPPGQRADGRDCPAAASIAVTASGASLPTSASRRSSSAASVGDSAGRYGRGSRIAW